MLFREREIAVVVSVSNERMIAVQFKIERKHLSAEFESGQNDSFRPIAYHHSHSSFNKSLCRDGGSESGSMSHLYVSTNQNSTRYLQTIYGQFNRTSELYL